jgi:hypothetical protein
MFQVSPVRHCDLRFLSSWASERVDFPRSES